MNVNFTNINSAYSQIRDLLSTPTLKDLDVHAYHSAVCNSRLYDYVLATRKHHSLVRYAPLDSYITLSSSEE